MKKSRVIRDKIYPEMYRVKWSDGEVSDMVNRTRAKECLRTYEESLARRKREGVAVPLGSPLVRLNTNGGT